MKTVLIAFSIYVCLVSCNHAGNSEENERAADSSTTKKPIIVDSNANGVKSTIGKSEVGSNWLNKILGTWALAGEENASFVIEKDKIYYPETFNTYKYLAEKDSIKIRYENYTGSYLVRMKGLDTLTLIGDEEQSYYRLKNK